MRSTPEQFLYFGKQWSKAPESQLVELFTILENSLYKHGIPVFCHRRTVDGRCWYVLDQHGKDIAQITQSMFIIVALHEDNRIAFPRFGEERHCWTNYSIHTRLTIRRPIKGRPGRIHWISNLMVDERLRITIIVLFESDAIGMSRRILWWLNPMSQVRSTIHIPIRFAFAANSTRNRSMVASKFDSVSDE